MEHVERAVAGMNDERRSRFFGTRLINTHFQFKFGLVVFLFLAAVALLVWIQGSIIIQSMVSSGATTDAIYSAQLRFLNNMIAKTFLLGIALTFGLSLFFSHFVAGPIYRFQKILGEMKEGKLNLHVQLRKHDELKEVADAFNLALSGLRNKLREERNNASAIANQIEPMIQKLRKAGRTAEASELDRIYTEIKNLPPQIQI